MTENESIKQAIRCVVGACDETCPHYWSDGVCHGYEEVAKGLEKDLEEIKQYRAIGTVKEIKIREAQFARLSEGYLNDLTLLREYQSIGTIEEFKALKEKRVANKVIANKVENHTFYKCPKCKIVVGNSFTGNIAEYCRSCGQKLDWSE